MSSQKVAAVMRLFLGAGFDGGKVSPVVSKLPDLPPAFMAGLYSNYLNSVVAHES